MDLGTLLQVNVLMHFVAGISLLLTIFSLREKKVLWLWGISNLCSSLGMLVIVWLNAVPGANLAGNLGIDLGTAIAYWGTCSFLHCPRRALWPLVPAAILSLGKVLIFAFHGLYFQADVVLGCLSRSVLCAASAWLLLRCAEKELRPASSVAASFHLLWMAMLLVRVAWNAHAVLAGPFLLVSSREELTDRIALWARVSVIFMLTLGYLWMIGRRLEVRLMRQAMMDDLTGIANRRLLWDKGARLVARAHQKNEKFAVLMIDLDLFKSVNDLWGHAVGDRLLVNFAETIGRVIRPTDILGRIGGDEFVLLLPSSDASEAGGVARRISESVAHLTVDGPRGTVQCTVSIGVAALSAGIAWEKLVDVADRALYRAKSKGRGCVETALASDL
jgi:diguanylate cyclase (GGDEF)-like protein